MKKKLFKVNDSINFAKLRKQVADSLDADGANVGDCLANANTVDANGKWKFEAMCSGSDINDVRFKEITGF